MINVGIFCLSESKLAVKKLWDQVGPLLKNNSLQSPRCT